MPKRGRKNRKNSEIPINLQGRVLKHRPTVVCMEKMRVLVANDPRAYREAIADVLPALRLVEVFRAEPDELEREASRVLPHLIVCSRRIGAAARGAGLLAWMVLYPDGEDRAEVGDTTSGRTTLLPQGVALDDLLSVVDETELLLSRRLA